MALQGVYFRQNASLVIELAGFCADAKTLQENGWELSVEEIRHNSFRGYLPVFRVHGRHRGANIYFFGEEFEFDSDAVHRGVGEGTVDYATCVKRVVKVRHVGANFTYQIPVGHPYEIRMHPVDFSSPSSSFVNYEAINFRDNPDVFPFREFCTESEILIPEKKIWTIQESLDHILNTQKPFQKELREKHRRDSARELVKLKLAIL